MTKTTEMRMYALHLTPKMGGYRWFTGFDEVGQPQWFTSKDRSGFMQTKHYVSTKEGWAEAEKIKATFKENWLLKMLSVPCEVEVKVVKMLA